MVVDLDLAGGHLLEALVDDAERLAELLDAAQVPVVRLKDLLDECPQARHIKVKRDLLKECLKSGNLTWLKLEPVSTCVLRISFSI